MAAKDLWAYHHGDNWREGVVNSMDPADRKDLEYLQSLPATYGKQRPAVIICHSVPSNWAVPEEMFGAGARCPPNPDEFGWVYVIGRTMFETDLLPNFFVPR